MKEAVLFVGHGSPMNAIGDNRARKQWKVVGEQLGKPQVIVAVSAHWMTEKIAVRRAQDNPQVNDMYGFPSALYEVHYEPASSVEVADKVLAALGDMARVNNDWGIDHGIWTVLCNMYPDADVPVVMVSVDSRMPLSDAYAMGTKLTSLREQGAMIVCSGNVVHNLGQVNWRMRDGYPWAQEFDDIIKELVMTHSIEATTDFTEIEHYDLAVPTVEHFMPLMVALGAKDEHDTVQAFNEYCELGSMSMTSYIFKPEK